MSVMDPVFAEVAAVLYPDIDARELWAVSKMMPDGSEMHVTGSLQKEPAAKGKKKPMAEPASGSKVMARGALIQKDLNTGENRRKALAAGLVLGTAAEGTAAFDATKGAVETLRDASATRKAKWIAGGKAGLQVGNAGVGLAAARELFKPTKPKAPANTGVAKALGQIIQARRDGVISTDKAIDMAAELVDVEKKFHLHGDMEGIQRDLLKSKKKGNLILLTGGSATAATTGYLAGRKHGKKELAKAADLVWTGEISKVDDDKRQVFGWCSLSTIDGKPVVDLQGDYVPIEEMAKSAYQYVLESRVGGDMHSRVRKFDLDAPKHTADLIESVVFDDDKIKALGLPEDFPRGWWIGFKVNDDEQWQKVKNGERLGFSIHGSGSRVPV